MDLRFKFCHNFLHTVHLDVQTLSSLRFMVTHLALLSFLSQPLIPVATVTTNGSIGGERCTIGSGGYCEGVRSVNSPVSIVNYALSCIDYLVGGIHFRAQ